MGALGNAGVAITGLGAITDSLDSMKPSAATYRISAETDYAVYVEFGTKYMEAQPYMRPAVNQTLREADQLFEKAESMDDFVELLAQSIADKARSRAPVDTGKLKNSIRVEEL